jgi:hypothetical protein
MDLSKLTTNPSEHVHIAVHGTELVCTKTPAGTWLCCAEEGAPVCARGFTAHGAAANWERAQREAE